MTKSKTDVEVKREAAKPPSTQSLNPFNTLRSEIDRLFDDFDWPGFRLPFHRTSATVEPIRQLRDVWGAFPAMDLVERNGDYEVQAELPGLGPEDIEVKVSDGVLTIKGEKSVERTEEEEDYHLQERSYGEFQRSFRLPTGVNTDKIEAKFDKGVLHVKMPKTSEAKESARKIEVKAA